MNASIQAPHHEDIASLFTEFAVDPHHGLSSDEARNRLDRFGPNVLKTTSGPSVWKLLLEQLSNVLILILLGATGLSALMGHATEAVAIAIIVLFAVLLGFIQEFRAEKALQALKKLAAPLTSVLRDGREMTIATSDVVPGDILLLTTGKKIGADARLIESLSLKTDEAALTGESLPVEKNIASLPEDTSVGDRLNCIFSGTSVVYGRGKAVVTATGMDTEFGKIAALLSEVETEETPLQKQLAALGHMLAKGAFVVVLLVSGLGFLRGEKLLDMVLFGIALAVAVVPEALPAVVTISLAIGVQRMVRRHALVRKLSAVETLGCTTVICSDKTGTLTKDEMTARAIFCDGHLYDVTGSGYGLTGDVMENDSLVKLHAPLKALLVAGTLSSDATLTAEEGEPGILGDPTEGALVVLAAKMGLQKGNLEELSPRIGEVPFTSETKRMLTLHESPEGNVAYVKGALESILPFCTSVRLDAGDEPISPEWKKKIEVAAEAMADRALRVICVASKKSESLSSDMQAGWTLLGCIGLMDPPRPEAKKAIATCKQAGIRVIMITGDHPVTARAIAQELELVDDTPVAAIGKDLDAWSDEELSEKVKIVDVFARVSPAHKLRIVQILQQQHHVVAMTGDGVNDAPALKQADIGLAMGIAGTDVSREASAVILTDDNFASIVAAVEEGRIIFGNIKKYLLYLLSSNVGEIGLMAGATILGLPLPLAAVQILYVNLATDGLPALALAVDPPEGDVMKHKPRDPKSSMFTTRLLCMMGLSGAWSTIVNLSIFAWALRNNMSTDEATSICFVTLVLLQFWNAYMFRSDTRSGLRRPFSNWWLNAAVLWEALLLVIIVEVPFFQKLMGTYPLPLRDWIIVILASATIIPVMELFKIFWKQKEAR